MLSPEIVEVAGRGTAIESRTTAQKEHPEKRLYPSRFKHDGIVEAVGCTLLVGPTHMGDCEKLDDDVKPDLIVLGS